MEKGISLEIIYKICLGTMLILTMTLFILHIFYATPDINKNLIFSFEKLSPTAPNIELANIN